MKSRRTFIKAAGLFSAWSAVTPALAESFLTAPPRMSVMGPQEIGFTQLPLSYSYNSFIGTSGGLKIFYTIVAFLFSEFYYPYYAYFVDPLPTLRKRV